MPIRVKSQVIKMLGYNVTIPSINILLHTSEPAMKGETLFVNCIVCTIESIQDFLIMLDMKPLMHPLEISTFSLNKVIVRPTKIMNRVNKN